MPCNIYLHTFVVDFRLVSVPKLQPSCMSNSFHMPWILKLSMVMTGLKALEKTFARSDSFRASR